MQHVATQARPNLLFHLCTIGGGPVSPVCCVISPTKNSELNPAPDLLHSVCSLLSGPSSVPSRPEPVPSPMWPPAAPFT
ncbi:hypothetical protein E2C01_011900 [Portunus trituberculatus]|uniref:Uncharacterized protein n=1 Tax=Portunus trituberculatus TaxID=210409 RepID=A0A5B7DCQ0_PORTR|nr:hypothetical protein [Portunus trituberculatus]